MWLLAALLSAPLLLTLCSAGSQKIQLQRRFAREIKAECPYNWRRHGDDCYFHSADKKTWFESRAFCRKQHPGADLISIHNDLEQEVIIKNNIWNIWIGLNSHDNGEWKWTDGTDVGFVPWRSNEPNYLDSEKCTELVVKPVYNATDTGEINNSVCSLKKRFGCKLKKTAAKCQQFWDEFGEYCYHFPEVTLDWEESKKHCSGLNPNAHLISIHSDEELIFVSARFRWFEWTGLNYLDKSGRWKWSDGTVVDYNIWDKDQPGSEPLENSCVQIIQKFNVDGLVGKWEIKNCYLLRHFTCHLPLSKYHDQLRTVGDYIGRLCPPEKNNCLRSSDTSGCPANWEKYRNACYKHSEEKQQWHLARIACQFEDPRADVVSLHSKEEEEFIIRKWIPKIWIGLHIPDGSTEFAHSDGTPTDYLQWQNGHPHSQDTNKCAELFNLHSNEKKDVAKYYSTDCKVQYNFICKVKAPNCGNGWEKFQDFCYYVPDGMANWKDAQDFCRALHPQANLPSIHNEEELLYLAGKIRWMTHLGLTSFDKENTWSWSDESTTNYTNWGGGEPNLLDTEKCVELRQIYSGPTLHIPIWNNIVCENFRHYICKISLPPIITTPPPPVTTAPPVLGTTCPPIDLPSGMEATCHDGDTLQIHNCNNRLPPGAVVEFRCKTFYKSVTNLPIGLAKCSKTGEWLPPRSFYCTPICGQTSVASNSASFIHHGRSSSRGAWPWHAALYYNYGFRCGASLISDRSLLTAAHCVVSSSGSKFPPSSIRVGLGKLYKRIDESHESVQMHEVSAIETHPDYDNVLGDADIAIIVLKTEAVITAYVRPVCYPTSSTSFEVVTQLEEGALGVVSGWGDTEKGSLNETELQTAELPYVSPRRCYETSRNRPPPRSNTFCAGFRNGTNVCHGDSGGGMAFPIGTGTDRRYILQGVVSAGIEDRNTGRCIAEEYSIFTRVSSYVDSWLIKSLTRLEYLNLYNTNRRK